MGGEACASVCVDDGHASSCGRRWAGDRGRGSARARELCPPEPPPLHPPPSRGIHLPSLSLSLPGGHGTPGSFQGTPSAGEATVKPGVCFRTPRPARPGNPGGPDAAGALTALSTCPVSCLLDRGSAASRCPCPAWHLAVRGEPGGARRRGCGAHARGIELQGPCCFEVLTY